MEHKHLNLSNLHHRYSPSFVQIYAAEDTFHLRKMLQIHLPIFRMALDPLNEKQFQILNITCILVRGILLMENIVIF